MTIYARVNGENIVQELSRHPLGRFSIEAEFWFPEIDESNNFSG